MCKYNSHHYWENMLIKDKDVWKSYIADTVTPQKAIFINTSIIDYRRRTLDNNWACHEDIKSLLGFMQYVYLPLAFFYIINPENSALLIPMHSSDYFIQYIRNSSSDFAKAMEGFILELKSYWDLEASECMKKIKNFCASFNAFWDKQEIILHAMVFSSTIEIAEQLISTNEFKEVLEEDIGMTLNQLFGMCRNFYYDTFLQRNFVSILNNKIGCII